MQLPEIPLSDLSSGPFTKGGNPMLTSNSRCIKNTYANSRFSDLNDVQLILQGI